MIGHFSASSGRVESEDTLSVPPTSEDKSPVISVAFRKKFRSQARPRTRSLVPAVIQRAAIRPGADR